jgi:hypothetical protein
MQYNTFLHHYKDGTLNGEETVAGYHWKRKKVDMLKLYISY